MFLPIRALKKKIYFYPYPNLKPSNWVQCLIKKNSEKILVIGKRRNIDIYEISMKSSEFMLESNLIQ